MTIPCPQCGVPLAAADPSGVTDATCAGCHHAYRVVTGTVGGHPAVPVSRTAGGQQAARLVLELPGGRTMELDTAGDARLSLRGGHTVTLAYTRRGERLVDLVRVEDHTTGTSVAVDAPGTASRRAALWMAGLAGFLTLLVSAWATGPGPMAPLQSIVAAMAVYVYVRQRSSPRVTLTLAATERRQRRQALLARHTELERARSSVTAEEARQQRLETRLRALRGRMAGVDEALYATRIASIDRAISLLERQHAVAARLEAAYDRSITMIEIEIESGTLAETVGDELSAALATRDTELDTLEQERAEFERLLAAHEEVERVLAGRSDA